MNFPLRLAPGLHRLGCYHLASFLIRGQGASALFETGISATAPLILGQLDALGVPREEVRWVILSHTHSDHATGQAGLLAGLPKARLVLSEASRRHLAKPAIVKKFAADDAHTSEHMARVEDLAGPWPPATPLLPGEPLIMEPGQALDVGGVRLELVSGASHAPGGLLVWLPGWGAFLASDSAGFHSESLYPGLPLYFVSFAGYLQTLDFIRGLEPGVLALGHQDWFMGPAVESYLSDMIATLHEQRREIRSWVQAGQEESAMVARMLERYYQAELSVYPPGVIEPCCHLLIKRSLEG